jgi:L-threonylcarbamoyladenylate synthase
MISTDIELAVDLLKREDIIGFPTETVYGLAANIYSMRAINKLNRMKQRPFFNPLIVHIKKIDELKKVAIEIPETAKILAKIFWPGPLTLLLKKHPSVPDIITGGKQTVAVRIPNHPIALSLLHKVNTPLAAPSANPFGTISSTSAEHVDAYFGSALPLVLNGGVCKAGIESTIIGFNRDTVIIYRLGAISKEEIEKVVGSVILLNKNDSALDSPNTLSRHYAPKSTLYLTNDVAEQITLFPNKKIGVLLFKRPQKNQLVQFQIILSPTGNLKEAASKLYASLHELDKMKVDIIIAERFPDNDLGRTINDRLERAAKNK